MASKSEEIRKKIDHPIIDSDGHSVEFEPLVQDFLRQVAGPKIAERADVSAGVFGWYRMTPEERRDRRALRPPWWALPTKNTLDRATSTLPKLLHERMDEIGLDFTVLYPSIGLFSIMIEDEELRRASCRALNTYYADIYGEHRQRMTHAAVIPMHSPKEAIDELEYAVGKLGLKAVMMGSCIRRPIRAADRISKEAARYAFWIDTLGLDSEYDYDPVWAKCVELKVVPTFHAGGMGWGARTSPTNYMYNHIGHFAAAGEATCKSLFMAGVTRRFPTLRFAFLECGVAWAVNLFSDLIGHWEKRNHGDLANYDPANLDRQKLADLVRRYGGERFAARLDEAERGILSGTKEDPSMRDEWAAAGIRSKEDIRDLFVPPFFFGCEADDPTNSFAFSKAVPFGARLQAIFSSDIGHWDVPDMLEVAEEAYELVDEGLFTKEDFRDFVFTYPVKLHAALNHDFFKGTAVEGAVDKLRKAA